LDVLCSFRGPWGGCDSISRTWFLLVFLGNDGTVKLGLPSGSLHLTLEIFSHLGFPFHSLFQCYLVKELSVFDFRLGSSFLLSLSDSSVSGVPFQVFGEVFSDVYGTGNTWTRPILVNC